MANWSEWMDVGSDIEDVAKSLVNIVKKGGCWESTGTCDTEAEYIAPCDGTVYLQGKSTHSRIANQNVASSASQHRFIYRNNELLYSTDNGYKVEGVTFSIPVSEGDIIRYVYRLKWVDGDAMYSDTFAAIAVILHT